MNAGCAGKLWDPLRTRAIPERLRGVFTTIRYTNPRLPLPLPVSFCNDDLPPRLYLRLKSPAVRAHCLETRVEYRSTFLFLFNSITNVILWCWLLTLHCVIVLNCWFVVSSLCTCKRSIRLFVQTFGRYFARRNTAVMPKLITSRFWCSASCRDSVVEWLFLPHELHTNNNCAQRQKLYRQKRTQHYAANAISLQAPLPQR